MFAQFRRISRVLTLVALALALASPATGAELRIHSIELDENERGTVKMGLRGAVGLTPTIHPGSDDPASKELKEAFSLEVTDRQTTAYWKPYLLMIDTTSISQERLDGIKKQVQELAEREINAGSRWVWVNNESNASVKASKSKDIEPGGQLPSQLSAMTPTPNPDVNGRTPHYSPITPWFEQLLSQGTVTHGAPTALIWSSLCVNPADVAPEVIAKFKGPMRFLTWDKGQHQDCRKQRKRWLEEARVYKADIEVIDLDDPTQTDAAKAALLPRSDIVDEFITLKGVPYEGGVLDIVFALEGTNNIERSWTGEDLGKEANEWTRAAQMDKSKGVKRGAIIGALFAAFLLILGAVFKARSQGMEVARWEAVGEAEDLSTSMDPDAWNATIFQLTGAMPALTEFKEAAQLGPSTDEENEDVSFAKRPEDLSDEPNTAEHQPMPEPEEDDSIGEATRDQSFVPEDEADEDDEVDEKAAAARTSATPATDEPPKTGMTVGIPVLDDGTGYDADMPFEIGVLQFGKPVARKTKRFRKVFSIGRATDNRVVIQKDDTVHRYHVVIRPAVQGKEWWLEVSPSASNRTNLNGKDLRSGGRYRLPAKFRLQLGEATEVRGRLVED